mmetsp:Transcript_69445/g.166479  ORF Transcript_69445/g.166479 Transcript_69445/m.166479 type:complete len:180 (-) Transcript_69445:135-674(-)|eukprot:CAMPEP_0178442182 /NCGR_PEP_ID=MMETSP0689_2-20121128/37995_1 /TAXON_ID=160604 /ORGANISM="Amphidinium massartii, Strain CS-259" /LENGTH=179 /DNA_ID=CAMNT_0020065645 /DNA_START=50 /DNA_END=589 /DNA_ORIENTATION=-
MVLATLFIAAGLLVSPHLSAGAVLHGSNAVDGPRESMVRAMRPTAQNSSSEGIALMQLQANLAKTIAKPAEACGTAADGSTQVGPSRNGYCANANQDTHAVCVTLPSDFCEVTGQSNWCADYAGGPWCVCMWAYATYVSKKGCGNINVNNAASDISGVCAHMHDAGTALDPAHQCLHCS